jgi:hypothetical protein
MSSLPNPRREHFAQLLRGREQQQIVTCRRAAMLQDCNVGANNPMGEGIQLFYPAVSLSSH